MVFLTGPPLKMSLDWPPPNLLGLPPPPNFSKCWNHIHFARHLGVFRSEGGPVWDSNVFLKSVTYRPTLSKFRGGPVKKNTLYEVPKSRCLRTVFLRFIKTLFSNVRNLNLVLSLIFSSLLFFSWVDSHPLLIYHYPVNKVIL